MRRIPVDSTKVKFISTGKQAARAQYAQLSDGSRKRVPDAQDADDQGRPGWVIDCLADDPDADRAAICSVKVYAFEVPEFRLGQEVRFVGLTCLPYVAQAPTGWRCPSPPRASSSPDSRARPRKWAPSLALVARSAATAGRPSVRAPGAVSRR